VKSVDIDTLLSTARLPGLSGQRALGRLIRLVDDVAQEAGLIDEAVKSSAFHAARIGLTGPPGSGKSSLIASTLEIMASSDKKIGILAVDPTSPFTGGALLGDRVRLKGPVAGNVFFRSLASRGSLGGVSRAIWPASRLLDWWGADIILIETVGSGQLGTGVADVADLVVAVLTPEAGDGIQSMKAGIMELADCFIVNKGDRPGSDLVMKELEFVKEEAACAGRLVEVFKTSAVENKGIHEAVDGIKELYSKLNASGEIDRRRRNQVKREIAMRVEEQVHSCVTDSLGGLEAYENTLGSWVGKVLDRKSTASSAAMDMVSGTLADMKNSESPG
jgi:LAO/AO transport system kinase